MSATVTKQTLEHTLRTMLTAYEKATAEKNPSHLSVVLAPDCMRYFGPGSFLASLGLPTDFSFAVKPYEDQFVKDTNVTVIKRTEISNVCVDVEARKAAATTIYYGDYTDGDTFTLEFAWFVDFNEDGTKVTKILEYIDTEGNAKFMKKIHDLTEGKGAEEPDKWELGRDGHGRD